MRSDSRYGPLERFSAPCAESILASASFPVLMSQAEPALTRGREGAISQRGFDKRLLILFTALVLVSATGSTASYYYAEGASLTDLLSTFLGGLTASLMVVGIPSYLRNREYGLTPRRRILKWMAALSVVFTILLLLVVTLGEVYAPDLVQLDDGLAGGGVLMSIILAVVLFPVMMISLMAAYLVAFGAVGVMSAVQRLGVSGILRRTARLSGAERPSLVDRAVGWMFDIPEVVDTRTLSLRPSAPRSSVSLSDLKAPVLWQLLFGFVLGIYISFNPFVSDRSPAALLSLFSLLTAASVLFPLMILPWFLFSRLGAGMKGQAKPFTLYKGIRSRMFQSYFAFGTLFILLRVSFQEIAVAFETYVAAFSVFMFSLLGSALLATFVYFNYFENRIAEDIVEELRGTEVEIADPGIAE